VTTLSAAVVLWTIVAVPLIHPGQLHSAIGNNNNNSNSNSNSNNNYYYDHYVTPVVQADSTDGLSSVLLACMAARWVLTAY